MEHIKADGLADGLADSSAVGIAPAKKPAARRHAPVQKPAAGDKLAAARDVVRRFLLKEFHAREVRVTKIGPAAGDAPGWYAEAEILVPDLGIKTLGLPLSQEVLARELCAIDLDRDLAVKSYEVFDPNDR